MSFKFFTKHSAPLFILLIFCATAFAQSGRSTTVVKPAPQPVAATQPPQVITIVHQLSGWKLRTWLAFTDAKVLEPSAVNQFVYTNIVAGYVLADGRTVVARLPEADAEMFNLPEELGYNNPKNRTDSSALTLVRRDGARLSAKFIGLDGSTWLTLMEAQGLGLSPSREAAEESLAVGQPVRLFAPLRAQKTQGVVMGAGNSVYVRVGEIKGSITDIARASTGSITRLTIRAGGLSQQMVGGVVLNEAGETVGLVETTAASEARVMPAAIVRRAAERVLKRRASVPRPLLGVRGEAIAATTLKQLEITGWKMEEAHKLLDKQQGVLLTMVTPNSPAALADLRAGDIIVRVNKGEVKDTEDFSFLLNEAGGGASVEFTYLRAAESIPREVTVKLSEAFNLRLANALNLAGFQKNAARLAERMANSSVNAPTELEKLSPVLKPTLPAMPAPSFQSPSIIADIDWLIVPSDNFQARSNSPSVLLINAVRAGSPAAKLGLRAGDVVISVNGQTLSQNDWHTKFLLRQASDLSLVVTRGQARITLKYSEK